MIGFAYRCVPALGRAKVLIGEGLIGAIRHVRVALVHDWVTEESVSTAGWTGKEAAGSGALSAIAWHAIDLIQHLTGQFVTEATGLLRTSVMHDGTLWATLGLTGEIGASIEARFVTGDEQNSVQIEVYGSRGLLAFDLENANQLSFLDGALGANEHDSPLLLVAEADFYCSATCWSQGQVIGRESSSTQPVGGFLLAMNSSEGSGLSFEGAQQVQRVLAAIEQSAGNKSKITPVALARATL